MKLNFGSAQKKMYPLSKTNTADLISNHYYIWSKRCFCQHRAVSHSSIYGTKFNYRDSNGNAHAMNVALQVAHILPIFAFLSAYQSIKCKCSSSFSGWLWNIILRLFNSCGEEICNFTFSCIIQCKKARILTCTNTKANSAVESVRSLDVNDSKHHRYLPWKV